MCECCYQKALHCTSIDKDTFDKLFNNHNQNLDFITTKKTCKEFNKIEFEIASDRSTLNTEIDPDLNLFKDIIVRNHCTTQKLN